MTSSGTPTRDKDAFPLKVVAVLSLLFVALRLFWLFMVPMEQAPDEFSHYWVAKFLFQNQHLPSPAEMTAGGPSAVYGSLPQLGYLPHLFFAAILKPICALPLWLTERLGSLFSGLGMLISAIYIGHKLFADKSRLAALAVPLLIVFQPQLILVHCYCNNDSTATCLSSIILALIARCLFNGPTYRLTLIIGLLCGYLALTKYSAYAIFPATLVGLLLAFRRAALSIKQILLHLVILAGSALALSGWWFVRTLSIYPGDLMGTKTMYANWAKTYGRDLNFHMTPWQVVKEHRWWRSILFSFWGLFGYMDKYMWRWVYWTYFGYATVGLILALNLSFQTIKDKTRHLLDCPVAALWITMTVCLGANILAMIYASTVNLGGGQGRYLFPSEIPIMSIIVAGLTTLPPTWRKPLLLSLLVFNICVAIGAMIYLFPLYGFNISRTY
ncbi:MAG: hypothetical protein IPL73_21865 [Candidatus Obscuribacter sp.]|nr:hypothetical protein [Candidatus Obscuribacter sp.]